MGNLSRDRQANARNAHKNRCGLTRGVAFISTDHENRRHHTCEECEEAFHSAVKYNSSLRDKKEEKKSKSEREDKKKRKCIGR